MNNLIYSKVHNTVTWLHYWQGNGLAIHSSRVQVLAGHRCVVALGMLLTPYTYNCQKMSF